MRLFTLFFLFLLLFLSASGEGQSRHTISGYISDAASGEKLIGANVFDARTQQGTATNVYGFYSLTLPEGEVELAVSYVGYGRKRFSFFLKQDTVLNISLEESLEIGEVTVTAREQQRIERSSQMSLTDIPLKQIRALPSLLGETDLLKTVQLLPGVQSGNEGQSGFYVRGGSPDQNLILLDGVPVYNASHLFGFYSIFNTDAISDVKLIKGGFPARYGGRLSSVLDIRMKDGNQKEFHGDVTAGLVSAKATLEGPVVKEKTSFIVSGRRTYADLVARPFIKRGFSEGGEEGNAGYYFYDLNLKLVHNLSRNDRFFFSAYNGDDRFYYRSRYQPGGFEERMSNELEWGNTIVAGRWNHIWSGKLFSNTTFTWSRYHLGADMSYFYRETSPDSVNEDTRLKYTSGIDDLALHVDLDYIPTPAHYVRIGAKGIRHRFDPGAYSFHYLTDSEESFDTLLGQRKLSSTELAVYVEDDWRISGVLRANVGLHYSSFMTGHYQYHSLQPRLSVRYLLPGEVALKASFATMRQYVQLLAFSSIGLPTDLWLPTTGTVKPQDAWQVAAGAAHTFFDGILEVSLEGYYKVMNHVLAYKEGAGMMQFDDWQERVTQGRGWAYGAELFVNKKKGKWTGWLGYTLAWSWRQFDDLNFGKKFHYKYDRRHDISLVSVYEINDHVHLSGTWVYGTGNCYTLANSTYYGFFPSGYQESHQDTEVDYYEQRNNYRMRPYHRLDLGVDLIRKREHFTRKLSLGAYNVYSRKNPFYMNIENDYVWDDNTQQMEPVRRLVQYSLFPVIPYFSLNFHF